MKIGPIFYLLKFLPSEFADKLFREGQIYFGLPSTFNNLKNDERGDDNEGAEWIDNSEIVSIKVDHPTLGTHEFKPALNHPSKVIQYNHYFLSYSLFAITPSQFDNRDSYQVDARMMEFGDTAVLIEEPFTFLNSIINEIKNQGLKYEANFVSYRNLTTGRIENITPFEKKLGHLHHAEFRIIIENRTDQPKLLQIGSIERYSRLMASKHIIETTWTVKRQTK